LIDGISIELPCLNVSIWDLHPSLVFKSTAIVGTSELEGDQVSNRRGLFFRQEPSGTISTLELEGALVASHRGLYFRKEPSGTFSITGSIHNFFNNGLGNSDTYTFENIQETILELAEFGVDPDTAIVRSFEIGLNIDISNSEVKMWDFLESIIYCKGGKKSHYEIRGSMDHGYFFDTTNVNYKFYDKSFQQKVKDTNIFRLEVKFTRMRAIENYGIRTLSDLIDPEKLAKIILEKLLKTIDGLIFLEWGLVKGIRKIPKRYKSKLKSMSNPRWWANDACARKSRQRNKILVETLVDKYAKRNIKTVLKDFILLGLQDFTRTKKGHDCTGFETLKEWEHYKTRLDKNAEKEGTNTQRNIMCDLPPAGEKRYCSICGKEITHQKKGALYCSDNRKCRDKAYNLKVSETRKKKKSDKEKEILKLIKDIGDKLILTRTTNPNRKKLKGVPSRKTSIIVTVNGKRKYYHGSQARFFLNEFEKKTNEPEPIPAL
jgi:hypothetical protein